MAITFDGPNKRIILDSASVSAATIWSRWVDWAASNPQWLPAFRQNGGDVVDPSLGIYSPTYFFLQNGWRVRPMEANQTLVITGNLVVEGGGVPVVATLGAFNVSAQYTVPVQAQAIATGGSSGPTAAEIAAAVQAALEATFLPVDVKRVNAHTIYGGGVPVSDVFRVTP